MRPIVFGIVLSCALALVGCQRSRPAPGTATAKAAKIVFVGKERPCACVRKSIDAGWAALEQSVGTPPRLPVVRLAVDTEPAKVEPYRAQKPFVALPAIFVVDAKDVAIDMLQGDLTAEQVAEVLKKHQ